MSRMVAAKAALATRVDALGEDGNAELGVEHRAKLEMRIKQLEEGFVSIVCFMLSSTKHDQECMDRALST